MAAVNTYLEKFLDNGHEFEQTPGDSEGTGKPGVRQSMGLQRVGYNLVAEQQQYKLTALLALRKLEFVSLVESREGSLKNFHPSSRWIMRYW